MAEALNLIEKAEDGKADFIEVRLDGLKDYDALADIASHGNVPLIAANRSLENKGVFSGSEIEREQTLCDAAKMGFEYVDLEVSMPELENVAKNIRQRDTKLVISFHDFNGTPDLERMLKILNEETALGADVCKIVTTAKRVEDNLTVLDFLSKVSRSHRVVSFCMGELGRLSRFMSPFFGAYFTIASLDGGEKTALGQLSIEEMRRAYDALQKS